MRRYWWMGVVLGVCGVVAALVVVLLPNAHPSSRAPARSSDPLACQLMRDMRDMPVKNCRAALARGAARNRRECAKPLAQRTGGWFCPAGSTEGPARPS